MTTEATASGARRSGRSIVWRRRRAALGRTWRQLWAEPRGRTGVIILAIAVFVALTAPLLVGSDALNVIRTTAKPFENPSLRYPLGTDENGVSVLAEIVYGSRISLLVGFCSALIAMVIGTVFGVVSGHFGGWIDSLIMRFDDWMLVIPFLPLVIVLNTILGKGVDKTILVLGITSWPGTARILRAQVLSIKQRPYMERARALGASNMHQMVKHTLPNIMPLVLANTTLTVAGAILSESALSFLGLGDPFAHSWGTMLDGAFTSGAISRGAWAYLVAPGVAIILVVLAFTWCGNALEKVLNPRLQER
ncbi:MAG TPA: ABC transporter permease [Micromonosporaceae bacterium]|nr:ABC transporter permease [Micromonosporaceae bacterium]